MADPVLLDQLADNRSKRMPSQDDSYSETLKWNSRGEVRIVVTEEAQPERRRVIARRLQEFNSPHLGNHPFGNLDVYVQDEAGRTVGGLLGEFAFSWLSIHVLWVEEGLRRHGIGTAILEPAEKRALEKACRFAGLDTMSFQSPAFYEKRGYVRIGLAEGYPGGRLQNIHAKTASGLRIAVHHQNARLPLPT